VRDGKAKFAPVKAGRSSGIEIQIIEGLKEGDELILLSGRPRS